MRDHLGHLEFCSESAASCCCVTKKKWSSSLPRQEFSYFRCRDSARPNPTRNPGCFLLVRSIFQRPSALPLPDALPRHRFATFSAAAQVLDSFGPTAITFASELHFRRTTYQSVWRKKFFPAKLTSAVYGLSTTSKIPNLSGNI